MMGLVRSILKRGYRRARVPLVYQSDVTECGAASLAMMLGYFGRKTRLADCYAALGGGRDGVTARQLLEVARTFGLEGKGYAREPGLLHELTLPVIVHMGFNHFAVLEQWTPRRVRLADPGQGRRWMEMGAFSKRFTGVALAFEPGPAFQKSPRPGPSPWRAYAAALLKAPGVVGLLARVVAATLAAQALTLAFPLTLKLLVDGVLGRHRADLLGLAAQALLLLSLGRLVATYLRSVLLILLRERLDLLLTPALFRHILSLPYTFFQRRGRDSLVMQVQHSDALREALNVRTLAILLDSLTLVVSGLIVLVVSPVLGLVTLAALGLQAAWLAASYRLLDVLAQQERDAALEEFAYLLRTIGDMESVKVTGAEEPIFGHWRNLLHKRLNRTLAHGHKRALFELVDTSFGVLGPAILLLVGSREVLAGQLSLGTMLALILVAYSMFSPLGALIAGTRTLQQIAVNLYRLSDTLAAQPEQDGAAVRRAPTLSGLVELDDVSFRYNSTAPPALRKVSLRVEPGQKVAVVGPSGAGKSTLVKLLLCFYAPTEGRILYDGLALAELDLPSVRRQLGVVAQGAGIMNQTLRYNIELGQREVGMERVRAVARLAELDDDIMRLPQGYKTYAGENGSNLSGGQRQRLLLARAFLHRPPILLLDEATSALDALTERRIEANLKALGATRIVVTHRLDIVEDADEILVLDEGRVAERGRHAELMARQGLYSTMVSLHATAPGEVR